MGRSDEPNAPRLHIAAPAREDVAGYRITSRFVLAF
jgi:hypothetical protein